MQLYTKAVTTDFEDMASIQHLLEEAFPAEERPPLALLLEAADADKIVFSAVYDAEQFVGLFVLFARTPMVYISLLAVDSAVRSKGYGSKIMALIRTQYPSAQIMLDIEVLDETAENYAQRKARKSFYLKNGYHETQYTITYRGNTFEILCSDEAFSADALSKLLTEASESKFTFSLAKLS